MIFSMGSMSYVGVNLLKVSKNSKPASLKARCVSMSRLMRARVSCGLSNACSMRASSSRWLWLRRPLTE